MVFRKRKESSGCSLADKRESDYRNVSDTLFLQIFFLLGLLQFLFLRLRLSVEAGGAAGREKQ